MSSIDMPSMDAPPDIHFFSGACCADVKPAGTQIFLQVAHNAAGSALGRKTAFAQTIIATRLGCAVETVLIEKTALGAPFIARPQCGLAISLSSREKFLALALSDHRVGVDIEILGEPFDLPHNILHASECAALERSANPDILFLFLWTAKEAYLKALGLGLSREPRDIAIRYVLGAESCGADDSWRAFTIKDCDAPAPVATAFARKITVGRKRLVLACVTLKI